jgi:hypothetical protein
MDFHIEDAGLAAIGIWVKMWGYDGQVVIFTGRQFRTACKKFLRISALMWSPKIRLKTKSLLGNKIDFLFITCTSSTPIIPPETRFSKENVH